MKILERIDVYEFWMNVFTRKKSAKPFGLDGLRFDFSVKPQLQASPWRIKVSA